MRKILKKSQKSKRKTEKSKKGIKKWNSSLRKRTSSSISFIADSPKIENVQNGEKRIHERNNSTTSKAPSTPCSGSLPSNVTSVANRFALPIFRQVAPLSPIKSTGINLEREALIKRHERLEADEKMLIRQDRIWRNEQRRLAVLKKTPLQQATVGPEEVPSDLKLIVHRRLPFSVVGPL